MADIQRTIVAKLRLDAEGDAELFGKTAEEIAEMQKASTAAGVAAEGLGKSFEQGTRAVESGSTRASAAVERIGVALANYREQIKRAEEAGATIGDEQIIELRRLEEEYKDATEAVGRLRTAQQQAKRDIDDATEAAGGQAERISGLDDIVRKVAEDLGPAAVKWLSWGTAAAGALTAGWAAGSKFREKMNELTGGEFDAFIQKWSGATKVTETFSGAIDDAATEAQRLKNELNVLAKNGIDVASLSAEEAHRRYQEFSDVLRENNAVVNEAEVAYKKWKESLPPVGAELDKLAKQQAEFIKRFAEENKQLAQSDLARMFGEQVNKLLEQYAALRQKVPPELKAIADAWKLVGEAAKLSAEQQVSAAGLIPEKLKAVKAEVLLLVETYRQAGERVPAILALQADSVGVLVQAWERVRPAVDLTTGAIEGGAAGLKFYNDEMERAVAAADAAVAAAERLQQAIDGVGTSANLAAGEVRGVFLGTPQIGGEGIGYNPLGID